MKKKLILLLLISFVFSLFYACYLNQPPKGIKETIFKVESGESSHQIAVKLKEKNLIKSVRFFDSIGKLRMGKRPQSGKYKIKKDMTSLNILTHFYFGKVMSAKVTIPEGYNIYEIADRLEKYEITSKTEFLKLCKDRNFLRKIGIDSGTAEGYLFPDTYIFKEDMKAEEVIKIMYRRFLNVIRSIGIDEINKSGLSLSDIIKLASLIEEEAAIDSERKYISSVFHNRLKRGMKLDCDPTVRYAVKNFTGKIYLKDLKTDSPYNTYMYKGFPPTPISSPGKASIIAAIHPIKTNFLYFVSRNDRSHYFSVTKEEHNLAVKKYRDGINTHFADNQRLN
jgi:UPF0755 protein